MNSKLKNQLSLALLVVFLALLVALPSGISAKVTSTDDHPHQSCGRAYGHFIAPGWIKKSDPIQIPANCPLPFGISKKLLPESEDDDDDLVDTAAPVISQIIAVIGTSTVKVNWQTDEVAKSKIYYGVVSPLNLNATSTSSLTEATLKTSHSLTLSGLATSTQYHLVIEAEDVAGNIATTSELSVHTGT